MLTCAHCGTANQPDASACVNCGTVLTQAPAETSVPTTEETASPPTVPPESSAATSSAPPDSAPPPPPPPIAVAARSGTDEVRRGLDIGKAFTFVFEDPQWLSKVIVGVVIALVPIVNFAWGGYLTQLMRKVSAREPQPLPDWSDFGQKFVDGFVMFLAALVYTLPGFVLLFLPLTALMLPALSQNADVQNVLFTIGGSAALLLCCLWVVYLLGATFVFPAMQLHYARVGTFASCFQVSQIMQLATANLSSYIAAWLVSLIANVVVLTGISVVGGIMNLIPCIGCLLSVCLIPFGLLGGVWLATLYAHLFGQVG